MQLRKSIQGEDVNDTANIPLSGLPGAKKDKRKMEQVLGDIKMCAPTHKHMDWVSRKTFSIAGALAAM